MTWPGLGAKIVGTRYPNLIFLLQRFSILTMTSFFFAFNALSLKFVCHKNRQKTPFLWPTYDSFVALTQCNKLVLRIWQKITKKETWSKLKITLLRKLDWGTLNLVPRFPTFWNSGLHSFRSYGGGQSSIHPCYGHCDL